MKKILQIQKHYDTVTSDKKIKLYIGIINLSMRVKKCMMTE